VTQNFAAAANLEIKIATAASSCTTVPQNANDTARYRMRRHSSWKSSCRLATPGAPVELFCLSCGRNKAGIVPFY
jgi:hypothetical protein